MRSLRKPRRRWEENIRMDIEEIDINVGNWVDSAQDRNNWSPPCECGIEPPSSISYGVSLVSSCSAIVPSESKSVRRLMESQEN